MQIFISHTHKDRKVAWRIAQELEKQLKAAKVSGAKIWLDANHLYLGESWYEEVKNALEKSQAMIALVTPSYLESEWDMNEVSYAIGEDRFHGRIFSLIAQRVSGLPAMLSFSNPMDITGGIKNERKAIQEVVAALTHGENKIKKRAPRPSKKAA